MHQNPNTITNHGNLADLYDAHFEAIMDVATERFHLAEDVAERLAFDVLMASLRHVGTVPDVRAWMVAATVAAASALSERYRAQ